MRCRNSVLLAAVCGIVPVSYPLAARAQAPSSAWQRVEKALQAAQAPTEPPPAAAMQDGPPLRQGQRVLLRFRAPAGAARVYLAGTFNAWARNTNGRVSDKQFLMRAAGPNRWYQWVPWQPQVQQYKFVVADRSGAQKWLPDSNVSAVDKDGNTILDFATLPDITPPTAPIPPRPAVSLRQLKPYVASAGVLSNAPARMTLRFNKVWVQPDQSNTLRLTLTPSQAQPGTRLTLSITTPLGTTVHQSSQAVRRGANRIAVPPLKQEGGYIARVYLARAGRQIAQGQNVLSVVRNVADDLRYGFYASYANVTGNYDTKAAMLADLHVNAVEFYDYFPAHGYYAPREANYRFEPFGTQINARDIQQKINAGHQRNILSLAYVAAYAASESVYRQHPYPMTDANGVPKVFNGEIMTEAEADRQKKPKWFWIMNVAGDSPWHRYITGEFGRALDDKPGDLVSFDGFEIDTYGDNADARFYAKGSKRNGDLLRDVLHDFVGDVRSLTHQAKPYGLVSFNSVNEFAVEKMYDVTDFLFLEIWHFYKNNLDDLVRICFDNRAPRRQRVVLKIYPADMQPGQKAWPPNALRRTLAATMTGAGSLMVAGEPDDTKGTMHGLNTLYYPDHQPLAPGNEACLRAYYTHDALLLGYTHGRDVANTNLQNPVPDCITRTYVAPAKHALVVQLLHVGPEPRWSVDTPLPAPKINQEVTLALPGGVAPRAVFYASPDVPALQTPVKLDFQATNSTLRILLPELHIHGTLILQY